MIGVKRLFLLSCNFCSFGKNTHVEVWLCLWRVCIWMMWPPIFKLEQAFVRDPHKVMTTLILDVLCLVWKEFTLQLPFFWELFQHFHRCGASIYVRLLYHSYWQLDALSSPQHWHTSTWLLTAFHMGFDIGLCGGRAWQSGHNAMPQYCRSSNAVFHIGAKRGEWAERQGVFPWWPFLVFWNIPMCAMHSSYSFFYDEFW